MDTVCFEEPYLSSSRGRSVDRHPPGKPGALATGPVPTGSKLAQAVGPSPHPYFQTSCCTERTALVPVCFEETLPVILLIEQARICPDFVDTL
jgi:hypothetical protein